MQPNYGTCPKCGEPDTELYDVTYWADEPAVCEECRDGYETGLVGV